MVKHIVYRAVAHRGIRPLLPTNFHAKEHFVKIYYKCILWCIFGEFSFNES